MGGPVGTAAGFVFPIIFVSSNADENPHKGKEQVLQAALFEAIAFSGLIFIALLFLRGKPPSPPR